MLYIFQDFSNPYGSQHLLLIGREATRSQHTSSFQIFTLTFKFLPCLFFEDNWTKLMP